MSNPRFLPWLRQGLAKGIGDQDDLSAGSLALNGVVAAKVGLSDSLGNEADVEMPFNLAGPGNVVGFEPGLIVKTAPAATAVDVPPNLFPFVELVAPDLPWLLTPARADDDNRLRPWLVLVCVEQRDGIVFHAGADPLPMLSVSGADVAMELPDLAESWAWAHVQTMVPVPQMEAALDSQTGAVISRLICPRYLRPGRSYRAAVVPAFDAGRLAGRGQDVTDLTDLGPAWDVDAEEPVELPVYATWTFSTSDHAADFEELAKRLAPDTDGGRLGYETTRLTGTALLPAYEGEPRFEYAGPLVDPGSSGEGLEGKDRRWFEDGLTPLLERSAARQVVSRAPKNGYEPAVDDPVVAPPLYGSWAAERYTVPSKGWLRELNLDPAMRAAAGLGATVVRRNQHEYLAAAWDQIGEMRALQDELNRARLSAEIGRSHARKLAELPDDALIQASSRLHTFVKKQAVTAAEQVAGSAVVPTAMTSAVYARQTRRSSLVAKRSTQAKRAPSVGLRSLRRFVAASVASTARPENLESLARYGAAFVGGETLTTSTTFETVQVLSIPGSNQTDVIAVEPRRDITTEAKDDLTELATLVSDALDPMAATVAAMKQRVSGVELDTDEDLPTRIAIGPRFPDPLFPRVRSMGAELVVPGVDELALDRVRLVEINREWIAAFCAGANHEWAREALWNEFPADLGATAFSTFWPRVPRSPDLNRDMHEWLPLTGTSLRDEVGSDEPSAVLIVRGDLIRRYPETEFLLVTPRANGQLLNQAGNLPPDRTFWPSFVCRLDPETIAVGFDVSVAEILAESMFVGIQEPASGPQFGLDTAGTAPADAYGSRPTSWADASWANIVQSEGDLDNLAHIRFAEAQWLDGENDGLIWPQNSAHLAGITFQQPFRLLLPAHYLILANGAG